MRELPGLSSVTGDEKQFFILRQPGYLKTAECAMLRRDKSNSRRIKQMGRAPLHGNLASHPCRAAIPRSEDKRLPRTLLRPCPLPPDLCLMPGTGLCLNHR